MLHRLYTFLIRLALPVILLFFWWQSRGNPQARKGWQQRLGLVTLDQQESDQAVIWVHAVSVGEMIAAAPLINRLLERLPYARVLVTAMTATGRARGEALFGERVQVAYAPLDTPGAVRRFIRRVSPQALVIMETELWPNLLTLSRREGVPVMLVNARLSERSAQGYQRVAVLARPLIAGLNWIGAQNEADRQRFLQLGATPEQVTVTGTIKFDVNVTEAQRSAAKSLRDQIGRRPVWVAASTHRGEEQPLLTAHRQFLQHYPNALLILVPRHPKRFDEVAELVAAQGFTLCRRSTGTSPPPKVQVYLGDTMGELMVLYGLADLAFVAGSLIDRGGHNPLEPAAWGIPVISGPEVFNFEQVYQQLTTCAGAKLVEGPDQLLVLLLELFGQPEKRHLLGHNAAKVVADNKGALELTLNGLIEALGV